MEVRDREDALASTRDGVRYPNIYASRELFSEPHSAQTKKQIRHHNKH